MLMDFRQNFATAAFSAVVGSSAAQVCMQHTGLGVLPHPLEAADAEPTTPRHGVERTGEWGEEREIGRERGKQADGGTEGNRHADRPAGRHDRNTERLADRLRETEKERRKRRLL